MWKIYTQVRLSPCLIYCGKITIIYNSAFIICDEWLVRWLISMMNIKITNVNNYKSRQEPSLVRLSGLSADLQTKGSPVWFPVRARAWVAGQVPSGGHTRGNHTLMFPSLSLPLPLCLKINKILKINVLIFLIFFFYLIFVIYYPKYPDTGITH